MNYRIKDIIKKANLEYSNGNNYILTPEELSIVNELLDLAINEVELVDSIYDIIYNKAKEIWPNDKFFTELQAENSGYGKEIIHTEPMGSMEELKEGDWSKWKGNHKKFLQSDKLDGCSIILTYKNGKLYSAATRGRGIKGKCIMRHIPFISNIPQIIPVVEELVVRGELLVPKAELSDMLKKVSEIEGKEQKNGRNTIAGALNRKETNQIVFEHSHFVAYWDSINKGQGIADLPKLGFEVPFFTEITDTTTEIELIEKVKDRLTNSKYELDGIILTQLDNPEEGLETGTINPKASRKFKIGIYDNKAKSIVENITWQTSKHGKLTPVLNIKPIELCGSTISNVTGSNYANLIEKECGIGSKVVIKRAGLVIPYLEEVLSPSATLNIPKNTHIQGVDLYLNELDDEVGIQKLIYFGKKLDIEQLGPANCKILYYIIQDFFSCLVNPVTPCEIYNLVDDVFIRVIGENGKKIIKSLNESKNNKHTECEFAAATGAFGNGLGERIVQNVYNIYGTLDVTKSQLYGVDGFEEKRINQYIENLPNWIAIRNRLIEYGVSFKTNNKTSGKFVDKVICFTGIRDKDFTKYLEENGAKVTETFTKEVNILIAKDPTSTSSKIEKAKKQGCTVISLTEAKNILQ